MQEHSAEYQTFVTFAERVLRDCGQIVVDWRGKHSGHY